MAYIYRHIRLDKNEPFYIGFGTKRKNFSSYTSEYERAFVKLRRSNHWKNIINITNYQIDILYESNNIDEIKLKEIEFIKLYGRHPFGSLVNLTEGGDGINNPTSETRNRMSISAKNRIRKPVSEETKQKISIKLHGNTNFKNRVFTDEYRKKLSDSKKQYKHSEETLLKLKNSHLGQIPWNKGKRKINNYA